MKIFPIKMNAFYLISILVILVLLAISVGSVIPVLAQDDSVPEGTATQEMDEYLLESNRELTRGIVWAGVLLVLIIIGGSLAVMRQDAKSDDVEIIK